ncbi:alpha/beta fold hydrolase [Nonomuraea sp. CA-143628]|uniref:alpha/beta fold hydrolase n=1 Tax=Nonomuraea sp. CA-143628 TaxID=3239997 RepID=UPI003D910D32
MSEGSNWPKGLLYLFQRYRVFIGAAGASIGVVIGIYSDEARKVIEWMWAYVTVGSLMIPIFSAALLCIATWQVRGVMDRRKKGNCSILSRSFDIHMDDFEDDLPEDEAVIGRELHYLERATDSKTLAFLLPGLGLDANDFRPYMNIAREHTAALTLFGFNTEEARNERYQPVGLTTHIELVNGALNSIRRKYPQKKMVLIGFSIGADIIIRLSEFWQTHPARDPHVAAALLLDPNVNHSSMIVSGAFATMNPSDPLAELKEVARIPQNITEFQNMSEYLYKISKKNLAHLQRHAEDWWDYWDDDGRYDLFFQRIARLHSTCPKIRVLFSAHYDRHFNEIYARAKRQNMGQIFNLRRDDHFELLNDRLLADEVAKIQVDSHLLTPVKG